MRCAGYRRWYYYLYLLVLFCFLSLLFPVNSLFFQSLWCVLWKKWEMRHKVLPEKVFFKLSVLLVLRHYYRHFFCTLWKGLYIYFNFLLAMFVYFHDSSKWKVYFGVDRPFLCKSRIWILGSIIIIINSSLCSVAYFYGLQKCRLTDLLAYVLFIKTSLSILLLENIVSLSK